MINVAMLWFFLVPIMLGIGIWLLTRDRGESWKFAAGYSVIGIMVIAIAFYGSKGAATSDTEIWNGQITAKTRVHGNYEESYECRCKNVTKSSGSGKNRTTTTTRVCDTCYRTHYTVKWECDSTVGSFKISEADWTNVGVYLLPNPPRWDSIKVGDPAAKTHQYTNYVQAVPESLFSSVSKDQKIRFASLLPAYPIDVFDLYRINRFISPGYAIPDAAAWNNDISVMLRELGPKKQVNVIVVVAKTSDPNYEYALRDAWEGANKNDVVLLIGSAEYPKIDFARVITWSNSEMFKIELRDNVQELGTIRREAIMSLLQNQILKNFGRRHMKEFEYLEGQIDPPNWLLAVVSLIILAGAGGTWFLITRDTMPINRRTRSFGLM